MKILLINPPRSPYNDILAYAPDEARPFIHRKLIGPPLGLLTIATALKDACEVILFDMKGQYDLDPDTPSLSDLTWKLLEQHQPDMVGVTVKTSEYNFAVRISDRVREYDPGILTMAGGLHPTLCPGDFAGTSFDFVIPGQAVKAVQLLVGLLEQGSDPDRVPGIYRNAGSAFYRTNGSPLPCDAAGVDFVMPDREFLRPWISTYKVGNSPDPSTYLFTSLGCPYKCTFCSIWGQFRGRYHQRDVESIISELKMTTDYPVVRFADANTVVDTGFMEHLFDRIREEGIRKTFVMDIRADVAVKHPALIEKMAGGGLKVVICGFESFRDEELRRYRKQSAAVSNLEAIRVFDQNGIMVRGNYVIPCDYTVPDFRALAQFSSENPVVYAGYTILTPMPGTVYHDHMKDKIVVKDLARFNFFNAVMETALPYEEFHREVGALWIIKKGTDVI